MNIKNKLYTSAGVSIALAVALISLVSVTSGRIAEKDEKRQLLTDLYKSVSELDLVTYDYLLHREKRMEHQWNMKHGSLGEILDGLAEEERLISVRADYLVLSNLFSQVTENYRERQRYIQEGASQEKIDVITGIEERLVDQLLITSHSIITDASRNAKEAHTEAVKTQRLSSNLILILLIVLVIAITTSSLLIARGISKPLNELTKGAEIIGKGDFEHKVEIKGEDELGKLAAAFNKMTASLLQQRHYLGERIKELDCLYRISTLVQKPETTIEEIFQGVVELLPPAWQYPEITGARILWGQREYLTKNFIKTMWIQSSNIIVADRHTGSVEVIYLEERPEEDEGPFLKEERNLINAITEMLGKTIESFTVDGELKKYQKNLEKMVEQRTAELDKRVLEVEQLNSAMVNLLEDLRVSNESLVSTSKQLAGANKELEAFAYSVSHDLRAPLRAITGFSEMLVEDYGDKLDEDGQRQLGVIQKSARDMGQLIDDLLAFSRLGRKSLKKSEINMHTLADEVIETFQLVEKKQKTRLNVKELPSAFGDQALIREVFANLLSNAIKYTRPVKEPVIEIDSRTEGNENIYYVKDNGVGFDMKYVDKLFQVFQRLHSAEEFEGTGIGLALVQRIIHRHGGRVWGEGKENEGATFYFSLPRS